MTGLNERGLREGLGALGDVRRTVLAMASVAEREMSEAEAQHNAMQKVLGFVDVQIAELRAQLETLLAQKEEPT